MAELAQVETPPLFGICVATHASPVYEAGDAGNAIVHVATEHGIARLESLRASPGARTRSSRQR